MSSDSIWFGLIRKNETEIFDKVTVSSKKSSTFIPEKIQNNCNIKLDIESGELDFLNGLEESSFENTEPFIENAEIEILYAKLFGEKFPILSDFYESSFSNPC